MLVLALDLEFNQPSGKPIQLGAAVGSLRTGKIVESICVHIALDEPLAPFITSLTGITEKDLEGAGTALDAYNALLGLYRRHTPFYSVLTWGGGDIASLRSALPVTVEWPFGRRWLDVKSLYVFHQLATGGKPQAGLARALNRMGHPFRGRKHNACDDAINTIRAASILVSHFPVSGGD